MKFIKWAIILSFLFILSPQAGYSQIVVDTKPGVHDDDLLQEEDEMWEMVKDTDNPDELQMFVETYPNSRWVPLAKKKINNFDRKGEDVAWEGIRNSNNPDDFEMFISTYPDSRWRPAAEAKLKRMTQPQKKQPKQMDNRPEEDMWRMVKDSENSEELRAFVNTYPNSRYVPVAELKIERLEREQNQETAPTPKEKRSPVVASSPRGSNVAFANENSIVTFGVGLAGHTFSGEDDTRKGREDLEYEALASASGSHLYVEYLFNKYIGLGVHSLSLAAERTRCETVTCTDASGKGIQKDDETWNMVGSFITASFRLPLKRDEYSAFGGFFGVGGVTYQYKDTRTYDDGSQTEWNYSASGGGSIASIYIDWGAEAWGGRVGAYSLQGDVGYLKDDDTGFETTDKADATGSGWYLDMRWSF